MVGDGVRLGRGMTALSSLLAFAECNTYSLRLLGSFGERGLNC